MGISLRPYIAIVILDIDDQELSSDSRKSLITGSRSFGAGTMTGEEQAADILGSGIGSKAGSFRFRFRVGFRLGLRIGIRSGSGSGSGSSIEGVVLPIKG